jgi:hypothetical protein
MISSKPSPSTLCPEVVLWIGPTSTGNMISRVHDLDIGLTLNDHPGVTNGPEARKLGVIAESCRVPMALVMTSLARDRAPHAIIFKEWG